MLTTRDSDGRILIEVKNAFGATNPNPVWYSASFAAMPLETRHLISTGSRHKVLAGKTVKSGAIPREDEKPEAGQCLPRARAINAGKTSKD